MGICALCAFFSFAQKNYLKTTYFCLCNNLLPKALLSLSPERASHVTGRAWKGVWLLKKPSHSTSVVVAVKKDVIA
jgi:hypothetical protein